LAPRRCNKSYQDASKCNNLEIKLINIDEFHEGIRRRLSSGNACYCFISKTVIILFSKSLKIRIKWSSDFISCFVWVRMNPTKTPDKINVLVSLSSKIWNIRKDDNNFGTENKR
jgi:hypothetical protein